MTFIETPLAGSFTIDIAPIHDARGFFAELWSPADFERLGLDPAPAQCSLSWNKARGTLRGMHFQREPFGQAKTVRCTRSAMLDVIVDLRQTSETYCRWTSVELSADTRRVLYMPRGFAHGYLTLTDDAEMHDHVSAPYAPDHAAGVRWDDPAFATDWLFAPTVVSDRDRVWPHFVK